MIQKIFLTISAIAIIALSAMGAIQKPLGAELPSLQQLTPTSSPFTALTTRGGQDVYLPYRSATTGDFAVINLSSCDTIDTDANGNFVCGTDNTGTSANIPSSTGVAQQVAYFDGIHSTTGTALFTWDGSTLTLKGTVTAYAAVIGNVSNTELQYLDGVTSNIQTQLNGTATSTHTHTTSVVTEGTNLYYTDARVASYISSSSTIATSNGNANQYWNGSGTFSTVDYTQLGSVPASFTPSLHTQNATSILPIVGVGSTSYDDLQDFLNVGGSAGRISGLSVNQNASNTHISVSSGIVWIHTTNDPYGPMVFADVAASSSVLIATGTTQYVYVDYNSGNPKIYVTEDRTTINKNSQVVLGAAWTSGEKAPHVVTTGMNRTNWETDEHNRIVETSRIEKASGISISSPNPRYIASTAGVMYVAGVRQTPIAKDTSSGDTFVALYRSDTAGVWEELLTETQLTATLYDDGSGTLAALGANKYMNHWIYALYDGTLYDIIGQAQYSTLADARTKASPDYTSDEVTNFGLLVAKIIVKQGTANVVEIDQIVHTTLQSQTAINHNDLPGIQGGTTDQYYHSTATEYTGVGTGPFCRNVSPWFTTPMLGAATATSISTGSLTLGDVTGIARCYGTTASCAATTTISIGYLGSSGTRNNTTYLRGDDTWQTFSSAVNSTINASSTESFPLCSANQIPKWNAGNYWACAADADSGADVNKVSATGTSGEIALFDGLRSVTSNPYFTWRQNGDPGFKILGNVTTTNATITALTGPVIGNGNAKLTAATPAYGFFRYNGSAYSFAGVTTIQFTATSAVDHAYNGQTTNCTAGEALAFGDFVYMNTYDGRCWKSDSNAASTVPIFAVTVNDGAAAGSNATLMTYGTVRDDTWNWTTATTFRMLYAGETAGAVQQTPPAAANSYHQWPCMLRDADTLWCDFNKSMSW